MVTSHVVHGKRYQPVKRRFSTIWWIPRKIYIELSSKRIFFHFLQTSHFRFKYFPFFFWTNWRAILFVLFTSCYAAWEIETRGFDWSDALISGAGRGWGELGEKSDVKGTCEKMTVKISRNWLAIKQGVIRVARVKIHRSIFRPCRLHLANAIPRQSDAYIVSFGKHCCVEQHNDACSFASDVQILLSTARTFSTPQLLAN